MLTALSVQPDVRLGPWFVRLVTQHEHGTRVAPSVIVAVSPVCNVDAFLASFGALVHAVLVMGSP